MSHMALAHSKQHLHNKKRRPRREHRCGAGRIPSKRASQNFLQLQSVREGQIIRTLVCESTGAFYSSKGLTSLFLCIVLFLIGILISVFFGILSLQESFLLTPSVGRKIFLYICKHGDQVRPQQGRQLRLLPHRGRQPRQGRQLRLLPR